MPSKVQGFPILLAGRKIKADYASPAPPVDAICMMEGKRIVDLTELVRMKLNSNRRKDQTHLLDMLQVGLIDATWPSRFEPPLADRLQTLIDDPNG